MAAALVVGAVALQEVVVVLDDALGEELAGHTADVDIGDQPVVLPDVARGHLSHIAAASPRSRERKVLRSSRWRLRAQLAMPQRSPTITVVSLALVAPV